MRLVPIECVKEKAILGKTIYDNNGVIMLKRGALLSEVAIKNIEKLNIWSVYIEDEYSEEEIEDVIKPELRQKCVSYIKESFNNIERIMFDERQVEGLSKRLEERKNNQYFNKITELIKELIDSILSNENVLISLVDIKSLDNYLYQHSINVTVLSLVIGISLKYDKDDLIDLALGALVHDIGKAFISKDILKKISELETKEFEEYKLHANKGYEYVKSTLSLSQRSNLVVLQHHERIDGMGYPKGLPGDKISEFAKIVAIADCYDYLTSDTNSSRAISGGDALEFIMAHSDTLFEYNYVKVFSKIIIAYPKGTIVRLSNGEIGVVEFTPANYPLRPSVKIIKSKVEDRIGQVISLLKCLSIVISKVEYDI